MGETKPTRSYIMSYIMEDKYRKRLGHKQDLKIIHTSDCTELKDLYLIEVNTKGLLEFKQVPLESIDELFK